MAGAQGAHSSRRPAGRRDLRGALRPEREDAHRHHLSDLLERATIVQVEVVKRLMRSGNRELLYESDELAGDAASTQDRVTVGRAKMEAEIRTVASAGLKTVDGHPTGQFPTNDRE